MLDQLKTIFLFSHLNKDDLAQLASIGKFRHYQSGQTLFYEGASSEKLYILIKGIIKAYKTDMKENEIVLHYFYPVSLVAEMANLYHIPFPATAEFQTEGYVFEIDYPLFERDFLKNPTISFELIKSLTQKLKYLENIITTRLALDATSRVAKFLYENGDISDSTRRHKIATILGLTPETLSRSFKKIKILGLISDEGKNFTILNREGLKELFT
ncbi:Crp/Fnr family transcriptional regulator [Sulfuricurvum sp.]|uniref:Crp/Fnr family transcriptional regulator n=1 Tax=Sulfuricurvum sp. TaxID=2025608 RepID=UPI00263653A1|nr:Crp/Fnr family transcriptional regulator [Sulfuricurvum sp.]MDD2266799.1 Crp/Fnr family transcriptional regulator [Sulfuricurvum sp.]MDD2784827.1 Crp/Fnr family transcriptional regulator [Sulfuricurvum sp.]HZF69553.1 Crp/Fnr family transcriptional regulator [Sulfuricurvum sp.]